MLGMGGKGGGGISSILGGGTTPASTAGGMTQGLGPRVAPAPPTSAAGLSITGPAPTSAAAKSGGGMFSKIGGFFKSVGQKLNPKAALGSWFKGNVGKFFGKLAKFPLVATLLEGVFANSDIQTMISNPEVTNEALSQVVGKRVLEGIGSVLGSIGGGALGSLIPIPGVGTLLGGMAGGAVGSWLGGLLADSVGAAPVGKATLGLYSKELQAAGRPALAEGGIVTSTGLAKVDKGEVYLGANSITVLRDMLNALQEQNKYLIALVSKDTTIQIDGQVMANVVAKNAPTTYGNLLNPSSRAYG